MPTNTYTLAAAVDDVFWQAGSNTTSDPYPPVGTVNGGDNALNWTTNEDHVTQGFTVRMCLVRWDTSNLPDTAIILSAKMRVLVNNEASQDSKKLIGEPYVFLRNGTDYTHYVGNSAINGFTLVNGTRNGTWVDVPIDGLHAINTTGYTSLRLGIESGEPTAANFFIFSAYEDTGGVTTAPQLIVDYAAVDPRLHSGYDLTSDETGGNASRILNAVPASTDYGLVIRREELNQGNNLLHYYGQGINPGVSSETAVTLTPVRNFAAGTPATTHSVTSGKTMRITNVNGAVWRSTGTTSPTANLQFRIRADVSGTTATTSSPIVFSSMLSWGEAVAASTTTNFGTNPFNFDIPEGVELPSGTSFMLTVQDTTAATLSRITNEVSMNAFEY